MLSRLNYLIKLVIFWLIFFFCSRIIFIAYHFKKIKHLSQSEILESLFAGIKLDLSITAYLIIIPFIIWSLKNFINKLILDRINLYINIFLIAVCSIIIISNIKIYEEWDSLLNYRAITFMKYPQEVFNNLKTGETVFILIFILSIISFWTWLFNKKLEQINVSSDKKILHKTLLLLFIPGFIVLGLRGGFQVVPINESSAYFSTHKILNHIAVNPVWYLGDNILKSTKNKNSFQYFKADECKKIISNIYEKKEESNSLIINNTKPNVIILILESYTSDIIEKLGGEKGITPNFDALTDEGLLFTDIYSSGFRTDQGIVSIISGFPAQPNNSIIKHTEKAAKLPNLGVILKTKGYKSSFYYGGETEFAKMNSYLLSSGMEKIISVKDFPKEPKSKWGVNDEYIFEKHINDLKKETNTFFSILLTLSNHEPFEVPIKKFEGEEKPQKFRNSAYYTDYCLGKYFEKAKKELWYKNTLFILVADHGHHLPRENDMALPASRKIPLLILGGALKNEFKGKTIDITGNHHDIPATLLNQMQLPANKFGWSKNLLNKNCRNFAYYANENGFGWITKETQFNFNNESKKTDYSSTKNSINDSILNTGKAYLQGVYQEFLDY